MRQRSSVLGASLWMLVITAILFWLPVAGPLIGGFVGGRKAGDVGTAIAASVLPALLAGVFFWLLTSTLVGVPLIGLLAGTSAAILVLGQVGPLMVGAIIGGAL